LVFADTPGRNIAWPSIVQHLTSIHPAVAHHNSHCINLLTPRHPFPPGPLLRPISTFLPPTMDGIPIFIPLCSFSIRNTIRYLCIPHHSLLQPPSPLCLQRPMNSLRPFFRPYSLHASLRRLLLFVFCFPLGLGYRYGHITQNIINTNIRTSHNDGVVVLMDVHENQKKLLG
jgi:hypothetical protein